MARVLALLLLAGLAGCSDDDLREYQELGRLRVIGLRASIPEVSAGTTVNVTPIVSDLTGAGRTLSAAIELCADPGVSIGAEPTCSNDPARVTSSQTYTLPGPLYTGDAPAVSVTVPAGILSGRSPQDRYNGVGYLMIYRLQAGGDRDQAFRLVVASERPDRNLANPVLGPITADGAPLGAWPAVERVLALSSQTGATDDYTFLDATGNVVTRTEQASVSWLISRGELQSSRTEVGSGNRWKPGAGSVAGFGVVVLRDDRGGLSATVVAP